MDVVEAESIEPEVAVGASGLLVESEVCVVVRYRDAVVVVEIG